MTLTGKQRQAIIAEMPWVRRLAEPTACDGIKWGSVALRDIFTTGHGATERPPRGIQSRSHCRNLARWRYTSLHRHRAATRPDVETTTRNLCWSHLFHAGLHGDMDEDTRTERWLRENHPEVFVSTPHEEASRA